MAVALAEADKAVVAACAQVAFVAADQQDVEKTLAQARKETAEG